MQVHGFFFTDKLHTVCLTTESNQLESRLTTLLCVSDYPTMSGQGMAKEDIAADQQARAKTNVPMLSESGPWTRKIIIYWTLMWVSLVASFVWGVYTMDVWPLAMWCAISITGILAMSS